MRAIGTPSEFDPADYEGGIVCADCRVPLTRDNVAQVDITDPDGTLPWDQTPADNPRLYLMKCVACALLGDTP